MLCIQLLGHRVHGLSDIKQFCNYLTPTGCLTIQSYSRVYYPELPSDSTDLVTQLCLTLCDPIDYSPPGSSVHKDFQARILEWVAIPFSRGSSQSRHRTWIALQADFLQSEPLGKLHGNPLLILAWRILWTGETGRL